MLGQLFSKGSSLLPLSGTSASSRPTTSQESVQEDIHTRNLLFPDAETLYLHQQDQLSPLGSSTIPLTSSGNTFDLNPEVDLDIKDVRVVIMQEATSFHNSAALQFDSHSPVEPSPQSPVSGSAQGRGAGTGGRSITSPRRISLGQASKPVVITQENSVPRTFGAFDRRPSTHTRAASYVETEGQRSAREYREEMSTFSNCIFGSSDIMAYKGTGTKVHIIPTESKSSSYPFDSHGSLGRSSIRSSKLAQSYTSENIMPAPSSAGLPGTSSSLRMVEKRKVLITRIFPVPLPNTEVEDANPSTSTPQNAGVNGSGGYPFPEVGDGKSRQGKKPKQKRTPMYAIGLIIQLPATVQIPSVPNSRSGFRGPSSYTEQESLPSSYSSLKPSGWTLLGNEFGVESIGSSYSEMDDRMDAITQHWDIIERTLSHLQAFVSESILTLLKQQDASSPRPTKVNGNGMPAKVLSASVSVSGKRVEDVKAHKLAGTNAKLVHLPPNSLLQHYNLKNEIDNARHRIVSGIKAQQVITRQGRWGIWREEARWVGKWAGGKEEGFFFYNFLTGFLGCHTEWLQALGPTAYRRHHYQQQRTNRDEEVPVSARTVIVAQDKMAARRLIFLMSAFLPPNPQQQNLPIRTHRPSTAASFGGYSQSPPSFLPTIFREESLRRKVNRRKGPGRNSHSRTMSIPQNFIGHHEHDRRNSDAMSLKTANLPIPGSDGGTRKSSAATTTTVTPTATIPHFSTRRPVRGTGPLARPDSSGSLATDDLIRSLKRGDSTGHYSNASTDSQGYSRWGSMISTLWSNKRRGSTYDTDITVPSISDLEIGPKSPRKGKLAEMVDEESQRVEAKEKSKRASISYSFPEPQKAPEPRVTHPAGAYESPVKTSINVSDGVIDIDVPLPDFITSSFGSALSSPSSSGYLSTQGFGPGLEGFEHYSCSGPDAEPPLNVGGWLPRYHPDFTLQAIPPHEHLEAEIKASMSSEPTPALQPPENGETTRWIDISTALIADTTNFTIKRIKCRRNVVLHVATVPDTPDSKESRSQSLYGNPYGYGGTGGITEVAPNILEEIFIEDAIISMDQALIEAVERIIAQPYGPALSSTSDDGNGSSSSGDTSQARDREGSDSTATAVPHSGAETSDNDAIHHTSLSVPEQTQEVKRVDVKRILLGALEELASEVADERQPGGDKVVDHERESVLKEGVRGWFERIEIGEWY
jgi:hypothetical protein